MSNTGEIVWSNQNLFTIFDCYENIARKDQVNAWMFACAEGQLEIVDFFLKRNFDVNSMDEFGWNAIHHACARNRAHVTLLLLERNVNPNLQCFTCQNWTPLHFAVSSFSKGCFSVLLKAGADPTIVDVNNKTADELAHESQFHELRVILANHKNSLKIYELQLNVDHLRKKLAEKEDVIMIDPLSFLNQIDCMSLQRGPKLGDGSFGAVYQGLWQEQDVAIKQLNSNGTSSNRKVFQQEVEILGRLRHQNIVNILSICSNPLHQSIILELSVKGTLYNHVHERKVVFSKFEILKIFSGIASGMNYLHSSGVIHRDLKSTNVLLFDDCVAKVADFGISKFFKSNATMFKSSVIPSYRWAAPEILLSQNYNEKIDVWSFGMMIFETVQRKLPWNPLNEAQIPIALAQNQRPSISIAMDANWNDLLNSCWLQNPIQRPSFSQIIEIVKNSNKAEMKQWKLQSDIKVFPEWTQIGNTSRKLELTNPAFKHDATIKRELDHLHQIFGNLHQANKFIIEKAFLLENDSQSNAFESRCAQISTRYFEQKKLFFEEDWTKMNKLNLRKLIRDSFIAYSSLFPQHLDLKLIPVIHAIANEKIGLSIGSTSFSALSKLDDGYFGKGIYFSTNIDYATSNYGSKTPQTGCWVILAWVAIGNIFPVIEEPSDDTNGLNGKPLNSGYDAHWTLVREEIGEKNGYPLHNCGDKNFEKKLTELVINQESQCLAKYLLQVKKT